MKSKLRQLSMGIFFTCFSLIVVFFVVYSFTKVYYWCISPDCFSVWFSIFGFVIGIGGMQ